MSKCLLVCAGLHQGCEILSLGEIYPHENFHSGKRVSIHCIDIGSFSKHAIELFSTFLLFRAIAHHIWPIGFKSRRIYPSIGIRHHWTYVHLYTIISSSYLGGNVRLHAYTRTFKVRDAMWPNYASQIQ